MWLDLGSKHGKIIQLSSKFFHRYPYKQEAIGTYRGGDVQMKTGAEIGVM